MVGLHGVDAPLEAFAATVAAAGRTRQECMRSEGFLLNVAQRWDVDVMIY